MMNGLNKLCRYALPSGVGVALLLTTSLASAERFPSTLEDYVTLYEIQSYQQCQHSSEAYQERLATSKEILQAMKKHKGKATAAAAKQWFMAACATPSSLPATPAFSYLKDVDPSIAAAKKQEAATTPSETFPAPAKWQDGDYEDFVESPENAISEWTPETQSETQSEAQAEYDWGVDKALRSAAASMGALSDSGAAAASQGVESAKSAAAAAKQSVQGLAAKVWGQDDQTTAVTPKEEAQEPFSELEPAEPQQPAASFDDFAQAENDLTEATAHWGSGSDAINTKITDYNNELQSVRSDMRVAFGGDGSELANIVERIEGLTETRSGLQAMIDLSGSPSDHEPMGNLVSLMTEFRDSMNDLKLILANAEMADKVITAAESEVLLQRIQEVQEVATQAEALQ